MNSDRVVSIYYIIILKKPKFDKQTWNTSFTFSLGRGKILAGRNHLFSTHQLFMDSHVELLKSMASHRKSDLLSILVMSFISQWDTQTLKWIFPHVFWRAWSYKHNFRKCLQCCTEPSSWFLESSKEGKEMGSLNRRVIFCSYFSISLPIVFVKHIEKAKSWNYSLTIKKDWFMVYMQLIPYHLTHF